MNSRSWMPVALGIVLLTAGCGKKEEPPAQRLPVVRLETVGSKEVGAGRVRYAGTIAPYAQTNLAFENNAYVQQVLMVPKNGASVLVDQGDSLPRGTVLARQDSSEFEARAAQARASVQSSQAQVAEAQAKVSQAQAQEEQANASLRQAEEGYRGALDKLAQARAARRQAMAGFGKASAQREEQRKTFERADILYHQDAMTKPDYDRDTANFEVAVANTAAARSQIAQATADIGAAQAQAASSKASISSAQAQVKAAAAQVTAASQQVDAALAALASSQAQLTRAEVSLSHCTLTVPSDSVLVSRSITPGTLAGPATTAFTIAEMHRVKVVFGVPDLDVDQLKVGQDVHVAIEAFPTTPFKGRITSISPSNDQKGRVYDVAVMLANPGLRLKNGMIANIEMADHGPKRSVITVPLSALTRSPRNMDAYAVVVVVDESGKSVAKFHDVKIGRAVGNLVEVLQGLAAGDRVVVGGNNLVPDGTAVQIEQ